MDNGQSPQQLEYEMDHLILIAMGHSASRLLYAAIELKLFDCLAEESPRCLEEIATVLRLELYPARSLMFGLSALGLVVKSGPRYTNTPAIAALMATSSWQMFQDFVRFEARIVYLGQLDYLESIRQNSNVGLQRFPGDAADLYRRLPNDPLLLSTFFNYMSSWSRGVIPCLLGAGVLDGVQSMLDIGGGDGTAAIECALAYPNLSIAVLETSEIAPLVQRRVAEADLSGRINVITQDMFCDAFPDGFDCVLFMHQLVIWSEERNVLLLRKAYQALCQSGKVVVFSSMANDAEDGPLFSGLNTSYFSTIPSPGGMVYSWHQYETWLSLIGFSQIQRIRCSGWTPHGIIVAYK